MQYEETLWLEVMREDVDVEDMRKKSPCINPGRDLAQN